MRSFDKKNAMVKANILAEQRYLESKDAIKENWAHRPIKGETLQPVKYAYATIGNKDVNEPIMALLVDKNIGGLINKIKPYWLINGVYYDYDQYKKVDTTNKLSEYSGYSSDPAEQDEGPKPIHKSYEIGYEVEDMVWPSEFKRFSDFLINIEKSEDPHLDDTVYIIYEDQAGSEFKVYLSEDDILKFRNILAKLFSKTDKLNYDVINKISKDLDRLIYNRIEEFWEMGGEPISTHDGFHEPEYDPRRRYPRL